MKLKKARIWNLQAAAAGLLDSLFLWLGARIDASKRRHGVFAIAEPGAIGESREITRSEPEATPTYPAITQSLNLTRRARALHMRHRGDEPHSIAAALGIPHGEVELLFKLDQLFQQRQ
jgi:hypothetical protein